MDVQTLVLKDLGKWLVIFSVLGVLGCEKTPSVETVFPKTSPECEAETIKQKFIIKWNDGRISIQSGLDREQLVSQFVNQNLNKINKIEPDYRIKFAKEELKIKKYFNKTTITSNSLAKENQPLADNWGLVQTHTDHVWQKNVYGQNILVAVIDTGIDLEHEQLKNQIAMNAGEMGLDNLGRDKSTNHIDDDQNGLIDDVVGYSFANNNADPTDHLSHGTHVSGIISAAHNDTIAGPKSYIQGMAPQSKILPLQFIDQEEGGSLSDALRAIDYAVVRGAQIINASWGGPVCSTILRDRIENLNQQGIIFVAAAGNNGVNLDLDPEFPAAFNLPSQLTVGAVGPFGARADFSNYSSTNVHLFAPGVDIVSTLPGNAVGTMSGTSMATPFVTGAVALLLGAQPHATLSQIRQALYDSAQMSRFYQNASHGRLDLSQAIEIISGIK